MFEVAGEDWGGELYSRWADESAKENAQFVLFTVRDSFLHGGFGLRFLYRLQRMFRNSRTGNANTCL